MCEIIIDWHAIRPLDGSRSKGFEELCSQLARAEIPAGSYFERKGTPDAGVECYAVLDNGNEWGWQAKYFDELGDSQWTQIQDSVGAALGKHPRLVRYFICIPLDRPDARADGRMSAKQRWDAHVKTWTEWASSRNMTVEFVYWGSHELLERLVCPEHTGRVRFWFDIRRFDRPWFAARLDEALKTAGPRYTPEIHVDLPVAKELSAFGRTEQLFDGIKAQAQSIRRKLRNLEYGRLKSPEQLPHEETSKLSSAVQAILSELGSITVQPTGVLPFQRIAEQIAATESEADNLRHILSDREHEYDAASCTTDDGTETALKRDNPFRQYNYRLYALSSELENTRGVLEHSDSIASCNLMILKGAAGMGKTHLLCDVARQRVAKDQPTVLLMGQRFVSTDDPWAQALQQLDLPGLSAEEFVGAIDTAAQAAGCRALVLIDAINEGSGRLIWPSHLAAFLAHLARSPWIGVLLSIRTSYEESLIPEEVGTHAIVVTHQGFTGHEYDATQTFFTYYGLELPSAPLLSPEFRNPFFLKTLCLGLITKGEVRLPHGVHGITAIFDLYLSAVNDRLASTIGFSSKIHLVRRALEAIAGVFLDTRERWLALDKAERVVNALLPGRDFEQSLYRGLVAEGILIETSATHQAETHEDVVGIAYDRFADHLLTKMLLEKHFDPDDPAAAFVADAPLAFLWDKSRYVTPGFLEAMCVQIAERSGVELPSLAPGVVNHWGFGDAFRQSLIWRDYAAFSQDTKNTLSKLIRNESDLHDTIDVLLTVATLQDHPLNARFLDQRLRKDSMPERDTWWSTFLHHVWGNHGSVDRLIRWASSITAEANLDDETVDLCSITLSWMLSTSNRFLRDNATQALVNLLTGRLDAVRRLVERFADIDDMYIAERVYGVAYGTAMRTRQTEPVSALAQYVYDSVFAHGEPPAHILLRDYARGIIERAVYLGATIDIVVERIRPPYASQWPTIPDEDDIKPFLPDWSRGSHDSGDTEWARNRIGSSVMSDDFAHYVISTRWTSLRLGEPMWQSPDARVSALLEGFSETERAAWNKLQKAEEMIGQLSMSRPITIVQREPQGGVPSGERKFKTGEDDMPDPELTSAIEERDSAFKELGSILTEQHGNQLLELLAEKRSAESRYPPRFDIRLIQRYILKRVFDLGWTTERFGGFDRYAIGYRGRAASKAERIGKKYQWIAYHEIMALVADHFQYGEYFSGDTADQSYEGPWQDPFRDIDPSCTLRGSKTHSSWDAHAPAWWCPVDYEQWGAPDDAESWLVRHDDLPEVEALLSISSPNDKTKWLNVQSFLLWKQPAQADQDRYDVERREFWYIFNGYLIDAEDQKAFMTWAEDLDFWGRWMPDPPREHRMFLGEYGWSPSFYSLQRQYFHDLGDKGWTQPDHACPFKVRSVAFEYLREAGGFDCSVEEGFVLRLPIMEIIDGFSLQWSGKGADFLDTAGRIAVFDPTAHEDGPQALLFREDSLKQFLKQERLALCWIILGEKMAVAPGYGNAIGSLRLSGAYAYEENGPVGFTKCFLSKAG